MLKEIFMTLADESRFKIIEALLKHNYCVKALAREVALSDAATSQHLKILREVGLLSSEKIKQHVHYSVNRNVLYELSEFIKRLSQTTRLKDSSFEKTCIEIQPIQKCLLYNISVLSENTCCNKAS